MESASVDYNSILNLIRNFFEYVKTEVFSSDLSGLIVHFFNMFPAPVRTFLIVGLCVLLFIAIIVNLKR